MTDEYFITGGAGFVGSNLVDRLLALNHAVTVYDNFTTGRRQFLQAALEHKNFSLVEGDLSDLPGMTRAMSGATFVYHLAANADVRFGLERPRRDLDENTIGTFNVLEAMKASGVRKIAFSSTGSIYGEAPIIPTPEDCPFPMQTSLYGASKLAGEGLIQAYCAGFEFQAWIFRFVGVMGERYTHGHVIDFYQQLQANPHKLRVLGDGHQKKSYVYVHDCIDAMFQAVERARQPVNIFNIGVDDYCELNDCISWITAYLGLSPEIEYSGGRQGWIGDNPFIYLDPAKIAALGWRPRLSIKEAVEATVAYLVSAGSVGAVP